MGREIIMIHRDSPHQQSKCMAPEISLQLPYRTPSGADTPPPLQLPLVRLQPIRYVCGRHNRDDSDKHDYRRCSLLRNGFALNPDVHSSRAFRFRRFTPFQLVDEPDPKPLSLPIKLYPTARRCKPVYIVFLVDPAGKEDLGDVRERRRCVDEMCRGSEAVREDGGGDIEGCGCRCPSSCDSVGSLRYVSRGTLGIAKSPSPR